MLDCKRIQHASFMKILFFTLVFILPGCKLSTDWLWNKNPEYKDELMGEKVGSVENNIISIGEQALPEVSVEHSLETYKKIIEHSDDPEIKSRIIRRMADLTMVATESRLAESRDVANAGVQDSDDSLEAINYDQAIQLYKNFLASSKDTSQHAETYYNLARAYDLIGETDLSMSMMNKLVIEFPTSNYYQEIQFRRGEILFADGDYIAANDAYKQVIERKTDDRFFEQALYKYAWGLYKTHEYEVSILAFFQLIDYQILYTTTNPQNLSSNKLMIDSQRAISLAFAHLDGSRSVQKYFETYGRKPYEINVYDALAQHYLRQERFKDAADTYQAFVDTNSLHPQAPNFQTAVIDTYTKGGFPSLILPAKEKFVENFGLRSEFWSHYQAKAKKWIIKDRIIFENVKKHLKTHLTDITSHYHSIAQKTKLKKDYMVSVFWYRKSLATFLGEPEARNINQLLAEALFDAKEYAQAIAEFQHTENDYEGTTEQKSYAAYFALTAYQKLLDSFTGPEKEKGTWIGKKILAQLDFIEKYPEHPEIANILDISIDDQLKINHLLGAIETSLIITKNPNLSETLKKKAWITIANGTFDLKQYREAELAYLEVLKFDLLSDKDLKKYRNQLATSIYKQAEILRKEGYNLEAAETFLRVGRQVPNSTIRATAEFDAAILFMEMSSWKPAIEVLNQFRLNFPNHELTETIPDKLAIAYEASGNWSAAANELEIIVDKNIEKNPELSRQALWNAAELKEKTDEHTETIRLYKKYAHGFEEPMELQAEAQYRLSNLYLQTNDIQKREFWLKRLVDTYKSKGDKNTDRTLYLASFAAFEISKTSFSEFEDVSLDLPLKNSLIKKKKALKKSLNYFSTVLEIGMAEFSTAATYKTAELYRILASDLMNSERPGKLNELELEQYEILLEEQALPFEDQAIEIYQQNTQLVLQQIYDDWVKKSFAALSQLMPGRYAKFERTESYVNEIR